MMQFFRDQLDERLQRMLFSPLSSLMAVHASPESMKIFDESSELMYFRDCEGRYTFVNQTFLRCLGFDSADAVIGRTEKEVFGSRKKAVYRSWKNDRKVLDSGTMRQFEETVVGAGQPRALLSIKVPVLDSSGEMRALFSMGIDISRQKLVEAAMQHVAISITSAKGENVLRELVGYICECLQVDFALIGRVRDGQIETLAIRDIRDGSVENFKYKLVGTPCESVCAGQLGVVEDKLQDCFPNAPLIQRFGYRSYAGLPLLDPNGQPIGILAVLHRDVLPDVELTTSLLKIFSVRAAAELERLHSEEVLRASEEQYRSIFNSVTDGLLLMNRSAELIEVNPAFASMVGCSVEDVMNAPVGHFVAPENKASLSELLKAVAKGERFEGDGVLVRSDGHRIHVNARSVPILYRNEVHNLTNVRDISREVASQQQLTRSARFLRAMVESSLDCIIASDLVGRIVAFNPMAEATFRIRAAEAIGKDMVELLVPVHLRDEYRASIEQFRQTGEAPFVGRRMDIVGQRADGEEFDAEITAALADGIEGKIMIAFIRDVTEQKNVAEQRELLQSQLRQSQKMEAIGHLAGGIAHDFNNLLTSLTGYVAMAQDRLESVGEEKAVRFLEKSMRSADRARNLVQQLLVFSRGQRGAPTALDLERHLCEFEELLRSTLPSSVHFRTDYADALPSVTVDPTQLDQVLMNLCINARDAMDAKGSMQVGVHAQAFNGAVCTSCRKEIRGTYVVLSVADSGPGIEPLVVERMFDPFFTTKPSGKGTGMGLSTTHGIVHDYGGHIVVDTALGQGATFRVLLPATDSATAQDVEVPASEGNGHARELLRGNVLVVDDDAQVLEFMEDQLRALGLEVNAFADPRAAIDAVSSGDVTFDLAILDQTMPGMSGLEMAHVLSDLLPDPRIVLYTGYSEPLCAGDLKQCCVSAVLHKPVDISVLYRTIKENLPI